ncbi:MAG: PIN domain-containing protein [Candidatus Korobacteraceae bacterium]
MSSDAQRVLRRLKPEKRSKPLARRNATDLPFLDLNANLPPKLLYDTTVYVDILQDRFPQEGEIVLRAADAWHSTVTEAELVAPCGFLDPGHPETAIAIKRILETIEKRPAHRTIAPDREVWLEAGVLSGVLARLQSYSRMERRRLMNDALLFATARKSGLTLLTRNISDFDLLHQLDPSVSVLFYHQR